jgi:cysteine-rich repeat protein
MGGEGGMGGAGGGEPLCENGAEERCIPNPEVPECMGTTRCVDDVWSACEAPAERCDGLDNDCDGQIDNGYERLGDACMAGLGICAIPGVVSCAPDGDGTRCETGGRLGRAPIDEICDDLDNDCDGETDEDGVCEIMAAECGNGDLEGAEACDDGNRDAGDGCSPDCQLEPDRFGGNYMLCGNSQRDASTFVLPADAIEYRAGCVPDDETRTLLIPRNTAVDGAVLLAFLNRGGNVITEYSSSDEVWNALFPNQPVMQVGQQNGECRDNINPAERFRLNDPFWMQLGDLPLQEAEFTGCGFNLANYPGIVPLGGHGPIARRRGLEAVGLVNLAYRTVGEGRLWLVEADWQDSQDGPEDWNAASQRIMRHMILNGRAAEVEPPEPGVLVPGVQQDVPEADVLDRGWRQCFRSTYAERNLSGADLQQVLDDCAGAALMLACRPVGAANLTLAAEGAFNDVTRVTQRNAPHQANQVTWYFADNTAWGFAPANAAIQQGPCDTSNDRGAQRLCWHTLPNDGGWRCGEQRGLNNNAEWERVIYTRDAMGPPAEPLSFQGIQRELPLQTALEGGFAVCHASGYEARDLPAAPIRAACNEDVLMLACRQNGSPILRLAAMANRADVFREDGNDRESSHTANGVGWYYHPQRSIGFYPEGEDVDRNTCDTADRDNANAARMCVHMNGDQLQGGWRCGETGIGGGWERLILQRNGALRGRLVEIEAQPVEAEARPE